MLRDFFVIISLLPLITLPFNSHHISFFTRQTLYYQILTSILFYILKFIGNNMNDIIEQNNKIFVHILSISSSYDIAIHMNTYACYIYYIFTIPINVLIYSRRNYIPLLAIISWSPIVLVSIKKGIEFMMAIIVAYYCYKKNELGLLNIMIYFAWEKWIECFMNFY
jgi:hypothetical protein